MPSLEIDFDVECSTCGTMLTAVVGEGYKGNIVLDVEPCETCLENAREEGREE